MAVLGRILGSIVWFLLAPGTVVGLIPWMLFGRTNEPSPRWLIAIGILMLLGGGSVLIHSFVKFVRDGLGTPAPYLLTQRLVVSGLYRYVRNPMYIAVLVMIVGVALVLGRWQMLIYVSVVGVCFGSYVWGVEEPRLRKAFPDQYLTYCEHVPRWLPRTKAWTSNG